MKHTLKKLLAALLACLLLLGSVAAMAKAPENENVGVPLGGVTTTSPYGLEATDGELHELEGDAIGTEAGVYASNSSTATVTGDATATGDWGKGVQANGGIVTVTGDVTAEGNYSKGVQANSGTVTVGTEGKGNKVSGGDTGIVAEGGGTVTVYGDVEGIKGNGVNADYGSTVTVNGGVESKQTGVNAYGDGTEVTVTGDVKAEGDYSIGVNATNGGTVIVGTEDKNSTVSGDSGINTYKGKVTVYGDVEGKNSDGVSAIDGSTVTVHGDVEGNNTYGVYAYENTEVTVTGDVKAEGDQSTGVTANWGSTVTVGTEGKDNKVTGNTGIYVNHGAQVAVHGDVEGGETGIATENYAQVTVAGNVKGANGVGMEITGETIANGQVPDENQKRTAIVVDGTVSGKDAAIVVNQSKTVNSSEKKYGKAYNEYSKTDNYNTESIDLTVWKAEGEDAIRVTETTRVRVTDEDKYNTPEYYTENTTVETDAAATETLLKRVNYIIKVVGEGISSAKASDDQTVEVAGEKYYTAHEGEDVKLDVKLAEGEVLEGVYYDGGDESTLTKAEDLKKGADGSFLIAMKRFGGMLLKLKTHTHTPGSAVKENEVAATCTKAGSYDEVVYCSACKTELSRVQKTVDKLAHTPGSAVKENEVAATCQKAGSYDEVVYCAECKTELSRTAKTEGQLAHTPGSAVKENEVAAQPGVKGSYDEVVYCTVCKEELSRTKVEIPALPAEETKPEEETKPADETKPAGETEPAEETADAASRTEFIYVPVDDNTAVNGVKAADQVGMGEAMRIVGNSLDDEGASIEIVDQEKLMNAGELERFESLSVKDRLLVVLKALGFGEALGEIANEMTDDAKALSESIAARVDALSEAEKQALMDRLYGVFLPRLIVIDGQEYEAVGIEVVITRGGQKSYVRYTFYKDNGAWKLYSIEEGAYRTVSA